ncbi:NlpC/P60 family protein [Kineosporia rhizophila]|uniref:C40 family peptidase n=1 Tax=Kineosporia rhizophila TaxID=84633 RepID=UPI001E41CA46|nr:NlpC/P60 family protein [Kineosporia rhizophila]
MLASPTAIAAPNPSVDDVRKKVEKLRQDASQAAEDYVETREKLKSTRVKLKQARKQYKEQEQNLADVKEQVGLLAAESYRKGELSTLELLLSDDPKTLLAQSGYLPSLSDRQASALADLEKVQQNLLDTQKTMQKQTADSQAKRDTMRKAKERAEQRLAAAEAELRTLEAADRATVENSGEGANLPSGGAGSSASCQGKAVNAPSTAAKKAIEFACGEVGDAYVWAATGPDSYDCSGLTMRAYEAAGISLPHSSRMQATYGTSISNSQLQPGDLVFFYSPISHVGIYLGDNMMVNAPSSGDVVKVSKLWATPTAAVRLA